MKDLLDKLSSYNLFNYLLPGTLFVAGAERITVHRFTHENIVVTLFLYYFIGLVVSRFGSLVVGPLLQRTKFVKFAPYKRFIECCKVDPKVELLSEQNNMYRTLCALFLALPIFKGADALVHWSGVRRDVADVIGFFLLFALFAFAYRKQTSFVRQRVEVATKD